MMLPPVGQPPVRAVMLLHRATLPAPAAMAMEPDASGVPIEVVPPVPAASLTRKYPPAGIIVLTAASGVTAQAVEVLVPVAEAYWMDQPLMSTPAAVGLNTTT